MAEPTQQVGAGVEPTANNTTTTTAVNYYGKLLVVDKNGSEYIDFVIDKQRVTLGRCAWRQLAGGSGEKGAAAAACRAWPV